MVVRRGRRERRDAGCCLEEEVMPEKMEVRSGSLLGNGDHGSGGCVLNVCVLNVCWMKEIVMVG